MPQPPPPPASALWPAASPGRSRRRSRNRVWCGRLAFTLRDFSEFPSSWLHGAPASSCHGRRRSEARAGCQPPPPRGPARPRARRARLPDGSQLRPPRPSRHHPRRQLARARRRGDAGADPQGSRGLRRRRASPSPCRADNLTPFHRWAPAARQDLLAFQEGTKARRQPGQKSERRHSPRAAHAPQSVMRLFTFPNFVGFIYSLHLVPPNSAGLAISHWAEHLELCGDHH